MKSYLKFLSRNKAYTAIDVFGLAISMMFVVLIGCYTWQESHVDKQHTKADRLYYLGFDMRGKKSMGMHWRSQIILKEKFPEIESSTAIYRYNTWIKFEDKSIETNCYFVDPTFYDIFDFTLIQGDYKTVLDNPSNIVVSQEYARKVWGDEDPMGKSLVLFQNQEPLVVAGVMEPMKNTSLMTYDRKPIDMILNFTNTKVINWSLTDENFMNASGSELILLAKEGHDLSKRKMDYEKELKNVFWVFNLPEDDIHLEIYPFQDVYFSDLGSGHVNFGDIKMIKLLFGVGLVILLFAIMNYINLTVALAGKRAKEMATRRLLGESRYGIMWRLIFESTVLCAFSVILGVALAFLMRPYASSLLRTQLDIIDCLNITTISFLIISLVIMSVTSGIIPAILLSSMKPIEAVKGGFRRKSNMIYGKVFIVIQNVSTIVMIACAITMYLQVKHLIDAPLGYDYKGVINIPYQYIPEKNIGLLLREELMKLPCVQKVSFSCGEPHSRGNNNTFSQNGKTFSFQVFICDSAFMDVLGIKLRKDNQLASPYKNYINRQALNELGLDEDTKDFDFGDELLSIAGILDDVKIGNVLTEQHPLRIAVFKPFEQFIPWNILIKINGNEQEALQQIKEVYKDVYSNESLDATFEMPFMRQQIESDFEKQKTLSIILTIFAFIAIMISMLGLMAMSTYYVRQRAADIAVYKVMGSSSKEVLTTLVKPFMIYVLIAAAISIPIIYYVMNDWLSQFSYRITLHWWIYAVVALLAIVICFVSVVIQCHKAANTNPINSLK
ncbi:MAG: ABC transporter permease [Muribaculaceae bacterium]|nr:ABC transporter permease [Muribaculaceae bacterium]